MLNMIFSPYGSNAVAALSIFNLIFLLINSRKIYVLLGWAIPLLLFLLWRKLVVGWTQNAQGHPLGIGLAGGMAILLALCLFLLIVEIITVKLFFSQVGNLFSVFHTLTFHKKFMEIIALLLPVAGHIFFSNFVFQYHANPESLNTQIISTNNQDIVFSKEYGIFYYDGGGFFQKKIVKKAHIRYKQQLRTGNRLYMFDPGSEIAFFRNGSVKSGSLAEDVIAQCGGGDVAIAAGQASFYENGSLREGILAQDINYGNFPGTETNLLLKKNSYISFYDDGSLKAFSLTTDINITVNGTRYRFKPSVSGDAVLYRDGRVKNAYLAENTPVKVSQTNFIFNSDSFISFYKNGSVKTGTLGEAINLSIGGRNYSIPKESRIFFHPSGKICGISYWSSFGIYTDLSDNIICELKPTYRNIDYFVHDTDKENKITDAEGYRLYDCGHILEQNNLEIHPDYWHIDLLIMFHYSSYESKTVAKILFVEDVIILYHGEEIFCPAMQWTKID
jgi:hypothetical protein